MKLTILVDNPKSWYLPYALKLQKLLADFGHKVSLVHTVEDVLVGDCVFFLSCEQIIKSDVRKRNKYNIVVHSSDLPLGKGWSPLTWQILEGKDQVTNTLFEAVDKVDAGVIYAQNKMVFSGDELLPELHEKQGNGINELVIGFVERLPNVIGQEQKGEETFFPRRRPTDSQLDPHKSIAEQFNLLRVVDNELYPAYIDWMGNRYLIKIYKEPKK